MSSNKSKEHDNERNSLDQHREEDRTDSDGYEDHDTAANHEAQANELHDSVARDSSSDDSLYGSELNDVLDGRDGNTDKGENHLNGGVGDDILVAGGSKTSHLDQFLANHQDVLNIVTTNQKWGSVASIANNVTDDTGGGVHNIFDIHSNSGDDKIFNFHATTDKIQLDRELNGSDISDIDSLLHRIQTSGNDLSIDLGGGNTITLVGVDIAGLSANNIAWA